MNPTKEAEYEVYRHLVNALNRISVAKAQRARVELFTAHGLFELGLP
jgi:hypothetical protein